MSARAETGLSFAQQSRIRLIERHDPGARIIGWHDPTGGPLIVRSNGAWQAIPPDGWTRTLIRGSDQELSVRRDTWAA